MEIILAAVILGLGIAFFALQNAISVPITLGSYHFASIPLYFVAIGALLLGLFVAWIINLFSSIGNTFLFHRQNNRIKENDRIIQDLRDKIHNLELENARLRGQDTRVIEAPRREEPIYAQPTFFQRLRHSFGS